MHSKLLGNGFIIVCVGTGSNNWNITFSDESWFCLWHSDQRVKMWRRHRECFGDCYTDRATSFSEGNVIVWGGTSLSGKRGLSSLEAISMQRAIRVKLCNQRQSHTSVWDQTLSSKMTTLVPTERGLSETASRIWRMRGWSGQQA